MGWLKVDDKLPRNPKILAGDIETAWLYLCALTHSAEQLTDGFIAESAIPLLAPHITDPQAVAERCVTTKLFERVAGGYVIPDYLEFNPSRDQVIEKRAKDAARKRGDPPTGLRTESAQSPRVPSRPVPTEPVGGQSSTGHATATPPDDDLSTAVYTAIVDRKLAAATGVRHPDRWRAKALANARTELADQVTAAITRWPTAPPHLLAGHILGEDARNLAMYDQASA